MTPKITKDLYQILEINPRARPEVIDAAYHALMKVHHPDVDHATVGRTARDLNEAHDLLVDPLKRHDYDKSREANRKLVGPYKLLDTIAEGGFGRTYKAEHTILKELACIKDCFNVSPQDTQTLIDEAKATWDLRHYALPTIRDLLQLDDGRVLLVQSYVPGPTLEQIITKLGKLDPEHVAWITERILNALTYLHRHGVVHGDLKPQNVIVQPEKHMAVIVDFGLSLVKPTSKTASKGYTPYFAPPEAMDNTPLVPESDYYSLGMTMIYALSGGADYVLRKEVPSTVPKELCEFIKRLIARNVVNRPNPMKEDVTDTFVSLREKVFGRRRSMLKPLVFA